MKSNVFVKPNEQNRTCSSYAMARKRRMKSNVFVKSNDQNRACSSYAMARKRRMKSNVIVVLIIEKATSCHLSFSVFPISLRYLFAHCAFIISFAVLRWNKSIFCLSFNIKSPFRFPEATTKQPCASKNRFIHSFPRD